MRSSLGTKVATDVSGLGQADLVRHYIAVVFGVASEILLRGIAPELFFGLVYACSVFLSSLINKGAGQEEHRMLVNKVGTFVVSGVDKLQQLWDAGNGLAFPHELTSLVNCRLEFIVPA